MSSNHTLKSYPKGYVDVMLHAKGDNEYQGLLQALVELQKVESAVNDRLDEIEAEEAKEKADVRDK